MKIKFEWEKLHERESKEGNGINTTYRVRVIGGWIVKSVMVAWNKEPAVSQTMVFIADPEHLWEVE